MPAERGALHYELWVFDPDDPEWRRVGAFEDRRWAVLCAQTVRDEQAQRGAGGRLHLEVWYVGPATAGGHADGFGAGPTRCDVFDPRESMTRMPAPRLPGPYPEAR
jgi:hypothetical protein